MTTIIPQVLLIADSGPDFGLGHLRRMEYLRDEITRSADIACSILSRDQHGAETSRHGELQPFWRRVCDVIATTGPALCVFDLKFSSWSEPWDDLLTSMQPHFRTIGIDVPLAWSDRFGHVVHPGVGDVGLSASPANCHGGPGWVLVAREPRWSPVAHPPRITVTTGSQGFENYFGWLEEKLTVLTDKGMEVCWVVGRHCEDQLSVLNSQGSPIAYVTDAQLTERFTHSSVVLTRFGVTAFELAARGVPTVILPGWKVAEANEVRELARAGVVLVAKSANQVPQLALRLASSRNLQIQISEKAKDYFKTESPHPAARLVSQLVSRSS